MGKRLNSNQWRAVLTERHLLAQQARTAAQRTDWARAFKAAPDAAWQAAFMRGKSPREAYAEWAARKVLTVATPSPAEQVTDTLNAAARPITEFTEVTLSTTVTRVGA
jgi:hypothetical protein